MDTLEPRSISHSIPQIYLGPLGKDKLEGFNSVVIELDARLDSELNWIQEKKCADEYLLKGYKIVWSLNFGLFHQLHLPLSDTSQYRSLNIALDHFFDFLWKDFAENTLGIVIYKGSLDFSHNWPWDADQVLNFRGWLSEQFDDYHTFFNQAKLPHSNIFSVDPESLYSNECGRNALKFYSMRAALDYFSLLTSRFESDLLPYVLLDVAQIKSSVQIFQLLDHEDFEFIQLALKNMTTNCDHALGWDSHAFANGFIGKAPKEYQKSAMHPLVGVVIPSKLIFDPVKQEQYDQIIQKVGRYKPMKLLGERNITLDWHGLEELVVLDVDPESKRKLEGFIAAGGTVVKEGQKLGLSSEISFHEYIKSLEG